MGITQLNELITEETPEAITGTTPATYSGKVLAIDASIAICQFQCAMPALTNRKGEPISVLQGLFQRTVFMLKNGIKPLYVFDGTPPQNKRLKGTKDGKVMSRSRMNPASTPGSEKFKDLKTLLRYLGVPYVQARSEAEATCAHLVVKNVAWGAVTEDMDALPFGCHRLIRNLKADKEKNVIEYNLPDILKRLKLNKEEFVDLCILLGCDYTGKIKGLGRKKALKMIKKYKKIENILQVIKSRDQVPPDFDYHTARTQFLNPEVTDINPEDLKWTPPDIVKVQHFLTQEKHMKAVRVNSVLQKLHPPQKKTKRKSETTEATPSKQMKIGEFFQVKKSAHRDKSAPGARHTS